MKRLPDYPADDRHACAECGNLQRQVCTVAKPGGVVDALRDYKPTELFREQAHRCGGFKQQQEFA